MPRRIRVLIADDSSFMRLAVERMLKEVEAIEVVGAATNGREALEAASELSPDVIVMDVNMPEMNGLEALKEIMKAAPTRVLMLSSETREGAETTIKALELGAVDFLDKTAAGTAMDIYGLGPELREKVLTVAGARWQAPEDVVIPKVERPTTTKPKAPSDFFEVVVIGASTGGPRALPKLLCNLEQGFPVGIVIAQHMPEGFTVTLAERLARRCEMDVVEAEDGMEVDPSRVLLAPGGRQTHLRRSRGRLVVSVTRGSADQLYRPSVDLLFESAARSAGKKSIGVVLTGMGDDGAKGMEAVHDAGGPTIVESEESAVIYGMPRVAAKSADKILPLDAIGGALSNLATSGSWGEDD